MIFHAQNDKCAFQFCFEPERCREAPDRRPDQKIVLKEIGAKWNKFSEQDLSALKNKDDLVSQVVAKYGLEKVQAQRDVDTLLKGRQI